MTVCFLPLNIPVGRFFRIRVSELHSLLFVDDRQTAGAPSSIELTASRPLTNWLWDAATADGTAVTPIMQLDKPAG